jgi:sarcosine oxidase
MTQTEQHYDTAVIGLGAVGAATLLQLASRGQRVIGIDRYDPPHALGSTHGETRITRCAIGEGEMYVPLALRSHEIWRELEAETGLELLTQCGALILAGGGDMAPVHGKGDFVRRTIAAAQRYGLAHEVLDAAGVMQRFPQFRLRGDEIGYFETEGGFVRPENCVQAQLTVARRRGAEIRINTQVTAITRDGGGVCITTTAADRIFAAEVVLAAGAWSPGLAGPSLSPHMRVLRQVLHWFEPEYPADYAPERFPVFIWAHGNTPDDSFYGFPIPHDGTGVKVAREQYRTATADPDQVVRAVSEDEIAAMFNDQVRGRLVGVTGNSLRSATCMYTMTEDGDFIIERAPENDRLLLVSACSGHGFKHSAGLGEAVAEAVISGQSARLPKGLSTRRFEVLP